MKKTIYIATEYRDDEFTLYTGYSENEAIKACRGCYEHLTALERKLTEFRVYGYAIECDETLTAEQNYNAWSEELFCMPDPDKYNELAFFN